MQISYTKNFLKNYKKRILSNIALIERFKSRLILFKTNPRDPTLKDHKLSGKKLGSRAFSITGDIRVVYYIFEGRVYLEDVGTHNQVY